MTGAIGKASLRGGEWEKQGKLRWGCALNQPFSGVQTGLTLRRDVPIRIHLSVLPKTD
jgi:hypothetical protein